ncbi:MAG: ATP-binding protein [Candidatus Thermoplasmatota archaeon]|jgi:hypothetical protein|nr:ATP-binding protein [Candidatus Thermoplasmatota archaeon]
MTFHDRRRELTLIREALERPYCMVVLTGRRRIGKTRLVREALKEIDHVELFIPRKRFQLALGSFRDSVKEQTGYSPDFRNFNDVLEYLLIKEKKVLFLDEVSNLVKVDPGSFSDLQRIMDAHKESSNIHLIMDGSYVSTMRRLFQDRKEPLFGRATDLIELGPLPVKDSVLMTMEQGFEFKDALEAVSLMGGVPRYLELLSGYSGMEDLKQRLFSMGSVFLTEGENLLVQEFGSSWDTYFSILEVVSRGAYGPSSIANDLGMPAVMLTKYLKRLMNMGLVVKDRPVFGKRRTVRYRLNDPFLKVWFRVCYTRIDLYRDGVATVPADLMDTAMGHSMENLIRDMVRKGPFLPFEPDLIGPWWDRSGDEIDIVACSKKVPQVAFGEVKWTKGKLSCGDVERFLDRTRKVDWHSRDRTEHPFIVSRSGFTRSAHELMVREMVLGLDLKTLEGLIIRDKVPKWPRIK